jgi:hypothetical protein
MRFPNFDIFTIDLMADVIFFIENILHDHINMSSKMATLRPKFSKLSSLLIGIRCISSFRTDSNNTTANTIRRDPKTVRK